MLYDPPNAFGVARLELGFWATPGIGAGRCLGFAAEAAPATSRPTRTTRIFLDTPTSFGARILCSGGSIRPASSKTAGPRAGRSRMDRVSRSLEVQTEGLRDEDRHLPTGDRAVRAVVAAA